MASLTNYRWQKKREERPNRTTNNGNMTKTTKCPIKDGVTE